MSAPTLSLAGKVAIVTGGKRGIGKAIALLFAEAGADIAVSDVVADDGELAGVCDDIRKLERRSIAIQANVARKPDVINLIRQVKKELGGIDILVNSAGIAGRKSTMEINDEEWRRLIDVNLTGSFLCAQEAARAMIEQKRGGSIINIASITAMRPLSAGFLISAGYASAKSGVVMLTKQMAIELAPHNIRSNAIAPGFIRTDMTRLRWEDPKRSEQILSTIPMHRWGEPDDIARAALFLASDIAGYITGVVLSVDGGQQLIS